MKMVGALLEIVVWSSLLVGEWTSHQKLVRNPKLDEIFLCLGTLCALSLSSQIMWN
jgi:hypothetical protein